MNLKTEADIQSEIMIELSKRGHKIFRANAGKIKTEFGTYIKLFPKGFPDLCGWRKSDGKFIAIEVKNEKGKLRAEQVKFSEFAKTQSILYGVARSKEQAVEIVEEPKMTMRLNPKDYQPTKKERIEHNMDNFDRKVGKLLDYYNAGEISEEQFISEIRVSHGNYKHNQRRIYNLEG